MRQPIIETSWIWRRTIVIAVLLVAVGLLAGLALATVLVGTDTALSRDLAGTAGLIVMSTVSGYILGAAWDDSNRMRHGRLPPPAADDPRPPPGYEGGQ